MSQLSATVTLLLLASVQCVGAGIVACYFESWAVYHPGDGKFDVEDIDPSLCTHLIYAFAGFNDNYTIKSVDPWNDLDTDGGHGAFRRFNALRDQNPQLKTILSVGGWNEGGTHFQPLVADPAKRAVFVASVMDFLKTYGFQGLDIDWEYPVAVDKDNFVQFAKELKEAFEPEGYLLTAATSAGDLVIDTGYDVPGLSQYFDYFFVMTYDYHSGYGPQTGLNSPMHVQGKEWEALCVTWTIQHWLDLGAPSEKVIVGIPFYGKTFILEDPSQHDVYAPSVNAGPPGPYSKIGGYLNYNELCLNLTEDAGWQVEIDPLGQAPHAWNGVNWMGYENPDSIKIKLDFAAQNNLGGVFMWAIDGDDFRGSCGTKYPLMHAIDDYQRQHRRR